MPLHDWADMPGWDGFQLLWMGELHRYLKERLPEGYRSYLGSGPALAIGAPAGRPDVSVRSHALGERDVVPVNPAGERIPIFAPDSEVEVAALEVGPALYVEHEGRLVAAIELVSPRNKDRPSARAVYTSRYAGYLIGGANLMLIDLHRRPLSFSFADGIAAELGMQNQANLAPPIAVIYRVGEAGITGGRLLAIWARVLTVGAPLPSLPLPLSVKCLVLEATYVRAAADSYLS